VDLADAIQAISELAVSAHTAEQIKIHDQQYVNIGGKLQHIAPPRAQTLCVSALDSVVGYVKANIDEVPFGTNETIILVGDSQVEILSALDDGRVRERWLIATPVQIEASHRFGQATELKEFLVYLMTCFERTEHRDLLIEILSNVGTREAADLRDNGMSQEVTTSVGVASRVRKPIPNPVVLAPFCTFPEIPQPMRSFCVRLDGSGTNITARLIPSASAAWRLEIRRSTMNYLRGSIDPGIAIIG
jgi:hypothetical protein